LLQGPRVGTRGVRAPVTTWWIEQGDALIVLAGIGTASIGCVLTDPPYCSGGSTEADRRQGKVQGLRSSTVAKDGFDWFEGDAMGTAAIVWLLRSVAVEVARVLVPGGSFLMFCDWRQVVALAPAVESAGLRLQNLVVWDKGSFGLGRGFKPRHELILHLVKGTGDYHDACTGNVIATKRVRERIHPTEKPVELLRQLLRVVAAPGAVVLDPFCGSGSTGEAALSEGRCFLGVERSPGYVDVARRRLAAVQGVLL